MTAIYGLCAPGDDTVRYVGQAGYVEDRLQKHVYAAKTGGTPVREWIRSLLERGEKPEAVILVSDAGYLRNATESAWIYELGKAGQLLNVHVRTRPDNIMDFARLEQQRSENPDRKSSDSPCRYHDGQRLKIASPLPATEIAPDPPKEEKAKGMALLAEATTATTSDRFDLWWKANGTTFIKSIHSGAIRWTHQPKEPTHDHP